MSNERDQADEQSVKQRETPRSKIKSRRELESGGAVSTRKPTPTTILVYVVIVLFTFVYGLIIPGEPSLAFDERLAISVFFRLMIIFLLVNRSKIGWFLGIGFEILQIVVVALLIEPPGDFKVWGMLFMHTAALALLLTGLTRQHIFAGDDQRVSPPAGQSATGEKNQENEPSADQSSSSSSSAS